MIPEFRVLGAGVQFGETGNSDIPVKDASSEEQGSPEWR
jgi:hypothetical protein